MPLEAFVAEAMRALEGDDDEVAVGMARELLAATGAEGVRGVFAGMNR